jgi:hypothetical protein
VLKSKRVEELHNRFFQKVAILLSECCHPTLTFDDCRNNAKVLLTRLHAAGILVISGEELLEHDAIVDAATDLLRAVYGVPISPGIETVWPEAKNLREAIGLEIEDLRGGM